MMNEQKIAIQNFQMNSHPGNMVANRPPVFKEKVNILLACTC